MLEAEAEAKKLFSLCGWDLQFVAGLSLLGGVLHLAFGLATESWGDFCGRTYPPGTACAIGVLVVCLSIFSIVLGQFVKKGNYQAILMSGLLSWAITVAVVFNIATTGKGWFELMLWASTAVFMSGAIFAKSKLKSKEDSKAK